nr:ParA family protein [Planctomycetota bacterium]
PSSSALGPFDLADQRAWEGADLQRSLVDALENVRGDYDYILCDCPPRLSLVSFAALMASDHVIIPLEAADWGAQGVTQVTEAVRYVQKHGNARLNLLGYLISRFKTARSYQHSYLAKLKEFFGDLAFDTVLPDLAGFEKSVTHAIPITLRAPSSREAGIARQLFDETEERIQTHGNGRVGSRCADVRTKRRVAV